MHTLEHLLVVHLEVVGTGHLQEVHVVLAVETGHFLECRRKGTLKAKTMKKAIKRFIYIDFEIPVDTVVEQQVVRHADPVWLHYMALTCNKAHLF